VIGNQQMPVLSASLEERRGQRPELLARLTADRDRSASVVPGLQAEIKIMLIPHRQRPRHTASHAPLPIADFA
jgi:hypothetical protein